MTLTSLPRAQTDVFQALATRRSVRAFLPNPVPRETVETILELAARAPSGSNIQPWKVWVVAGEAKDRVTAKILAAYDADDPSHAEEYAYYPDQWTEPFVGRRRKLGKDLYSLVGIGKGDTAAMKRQTGRNYSFFGAPVGMFLTVDGGMNQGSWLDTGTFLQSVLVAARGFGLDTCPQQSFSKYHRIIKDELGIPEDQKIACGIALGYIDEGAPENALVTEREPLSQFSTFLWD